MYRFFNLVVIGFALVLTGCPSSGTTAPLTEERFIELQTDLAQQAVAQNQADMKKIVKHEIDERIKPFEQEMTKMEGRLLMEVAEQGGETRAQITELGATLGRNHAAVVATLTQQGDRLQRIEDRPVAVPSVPVAGPSGPALGSSGNLKLKSRKGGDGFQVESFEVPATLNELNEFYEKQAQRRQRQSEESFERMERIKMMDALIDKNADVNSRVSAIDQQLQEAITDFQRRQALTQGGVTNMGTRLESLHQVVEKLAAANRAEVVDHPPVPVPTTGYIPCGSWKVYRRGRLIHVW